MATRKKFKTEVQQLLDLVIHSLYSKKEIFLRELISNSSDACDRARFESLQNKEMLGDTSEFKIKLIIDKEARTLTITDTGIGMNVAEVEKNIGTIANSGTRAFLKEMKEGNVAGSPELIGQFGVGFYSAFMVADKVTVITKRAGEDGPAVKWESIGDGSYTLDQADREKHGTDVTLHLREEMDEYLEPWKLRKTVKQYSDYVSYPIVIDVEKDITETDDEGNPVEGAEKKVEIVEETINSRKALWKRPKSEITEDEYKEFYRAISHDFQEPLETVHYMAEGVTEFRALMFIPKRAPYDMYAADGRHKGLQLYVRNVYITDECKELMPEYLRFVKGVVDSSDLPLNVSREILQDDAIIRRIRKSLVSKILSTLKDLKEKRADDYVAFYKEFGKVLKEGIHFDHENKDKLQDLLLFQSSTTESGTYSSLREYVTRMPESQTTIYYLASDSRDAAENSPHLELFRSRSLEVLFFTDPIDEWVVQSLTDYDGKKLVAIDRGDVELPAEDETTKKEREEKKAESSKLYGDVIGTIKELLKDEVKDVRLSDRLTDSACCLVADEYGMNAHMERIMKAMGQDSVPSKRILELNPTHPVMGVMKSLHAQDAASKKLSNYVELLYNQALLTEGSAIKNPLRFTQLVSELMVAEGQEAAIAN